MSVSESQRQQLQRIIEQLSVSLEASQSLGGSDCELSDIESTLRQLHDKLAKLCNREMLPFYEPNYGNDFRKILPRSPLSGHFNPISPQLKIYSKDKVVYAEGAFGLIHQGPPNCVHGGIISGVYDQVLAFCGIANGTPGFTANLQVSYLKPTPLFKPLRFSCHISKVEDRQIFIKGECHYEEERLTTAEGLFIHYENAANSSSLKGQRLE
jgi:acyl-coenzyme A thioesterase PaaI-like protein